jgi:hypothetical protein
VHFTTKTAEVFTDRERAEAVGFYALVKRRGRAASASLLGTNAKIRPAVFESPKSGLSAQGVGDLQGLSPVVLRYALQAGARELLGPVLLEGEQIWSGQRKDGRQHRTCHCCRRPIDAESSVEVWTAPQHKTARFGNVQTCGSVWACPVCAVRVSEVRRKELQAAVDTWRARGGRVVLVTRTVSHYAFETMAGVLDLLKSAMHRASKSRAACRLREKFGIVGHVRSLEVTWGRNGWHPHVHELLFIEGDYDLAALSTEMGAIWGQAVEVSGGRALHGQHGFDAVDCDGRIAAYVSKWGREPDWKESHELAKAVSKKGRKGGQFTPGELLAQFSFQGNLYAGRKWVEYVLAMHGKHQLQYSRGLKRLLGLADISDDEAAAAPLDGGLLWASIPLTAWRKLCRMEERGRLLRLAAEGDFAGFHDLLSELVPELDAELEAEEQAAHGWPVAPKNLRDTSDKSICWHVDRRMDAAQDAAALGFSPEVAQDLRQRARKIRLAAGGESGDYQAGLARVSMLDEHAVQRGKQLFDIMRDSLAKQVDV